MSLSSGSFTRPKALSFTMLSSRGMRYSEDDTPLSFLCSAVAIKLSTSFALLRMILFSRALGSKKYSPDNSSSASATLICSDAGGNSLEPTAFQSVTAFPELAMRTRSPPRAANPRRLNKVFSLSRLFCIVFQFAAPKNMSFMSEESFGSNRIPWLWRG